MKWYSAGFYFNLPSTFSKYAVYFIFVHIFNNFFICEKTDNKVGLQNRIKKLEANII